MNQGKIRFKLLKAIPYGSSVELYNVNVLASRTNLKFLHTAVDAAWKLLGDEVLFPTAMETREPQVIFKTILLYL